MTTAQTELPSQTSTATPHAAGRSLAVLRILLGSLFVWAFADKAFGLGFATTPAKSWLQGGSPTAGYLGHVDGWFGGTFQRMAGNAIIDASFMLALLLVGVALVLGIALRAAAVGGTLLMAMMWLSSLPLSMNPVVDEHIIYASAMIALAAAGAGRTWGLEARWQQLLRSLPQGARKLLA